MAKLFPMEVEFVRDKDDAGFYPHHVENLTKGKIYTAIALVKYGEDTCFVVADDTGRFVHAAIESFSIPTPRQKKREADAEITCNIKRVGYFNE